MKKIVISENQLRRLSKNLVESPEKGSYMAKQQLFVIATLAYKMWESMEDGEQLEDWMETKIAQSEQSITSVVKRGLAPRGAGGKFVSRSSIKFALAAHIQKYGIRPSLFFTKPFEEAYKTLPDTLIDKYGLDADPCATPQVRCIAVLNTSACHAEYMIDSGQITRTFLITPLFIR